LELELDQITRAEQPAFCSYPDKCDRGYVPSYDWGAPTLGDRHERIWEAVWHIPGWLEVEDALKLYELAYFAAGPILEIGTYCGRSAVVSATALADRGNGGALVSLDIDSLALSLAQRSARAHSVDEYIVFACTSADKFLRTFPAFAPSVIFIDADHSEQGVHADLAALESCVSVDTLLLFHDYFPMALPNTEGFPVSAEPIEVAETVNKSWLATRAQFAGTFGASGLFRVVR